MNSERLQQQGRLAELKRRFSDLDTEASGHILVIRQEVDPFADSVLGLRIDRAQISMARLAEIIEEMRKLDERIEQLEKYLG